MQLQRDIVEAAETAEKVKGGFEPLKPGKYLGRLSAVDCRYTENGNEYWSWEFTDLHTMGGERISGRQWMTTQMPGAAQRHDQDDEKYAKAQAFHAGRLRQIFEDVFDATLDTDTEDLIGEVVILNIGITTLQRGARAGEKTNQVNSLERANDEQIVLLDEDESGF